MIALINNTLDSLVETFKNLSAVAIIVAGLWTLYNHIRSRTFQRRLLIDIKTSSKTLHKMQILFVEVELTNSGKGKLAAKRVGPEDYVYKDAEEQLKYSCSLQIKRVNAEKLSDETFLDWYKCSALEFVSNIPAEINLLDDYVVPAENNEIVFWLEPGDVAHLSAPLILKPGHYLLKVSFYGENPDEDFWSRLAYVSVKD
jgi:hypothetical protein